MSKTHTVVWTRRSQDQMKSAYDYISKDSVASAQKVISSITDAFEKARAYPEMYRPDKYKTNNDGTYRAFELYHYRIAYRFANNVIRVLQVRHTAMKPKFY